jgi:hypothetical protein
MKTLITRGVALVACAVLGLLLGGQAQGQLLRADIPFGFYVGDAVLPAGQYEVRIESASRAVAVTSVDGLAYARFFAAFGNAAGGGRPCLVFLKYGHTSYLSSVQTALSPFGLRAPETRKSREAKRVASASTRQDVAEVRVPVVRISR